MDLIQAAQNMARKYHQGQKYGDKDYYDAHLQKVANAVNNEISICHPDWHYGKVAAYIATAYCHDILEDTTATKEMLVELLGEHIADAVDALTKREGEDYDAYLQRVKENDMARFVKKRDAQMNYLACVGSGDYKRMRKYSKALGVLSEGRVVL